MTCCGCDFSNEALVYAKGPFACGAWGSNHHDTTYIWLKPEYHTEDEVRYCDNCINQLVYERKLEVISSYSCNEDGDILSEDALREMFAHGADKALKARLSASDTPIPEHLAAEDWAEKVRSLRQALHWDETYNNHIQWPPYRKDADHAEKIGAAHAISAISLGWVHKDPDFRSAATAWAGDRKSYTDACKKSLDYLANFLEGDMLDEPLPEGRAIVFNLLGG